MRKIFSLLSIFSFIFLLFTSAAEAQLNFYFINVGQGDATYIELPNGKNALIDGGPTNKVIAQFLTEKNIHEIDYVVLTHPHSDHYIGLKKVFKMAKVKHFYDSKAENISAKGDNTVRDQAAQQGTQIHFPKIGAKLPWDKSVDIKVLNTCEYYIESRNNSVLNNCSIVLKFTYNGTSVLMMGDAETQAENGMILRFPNELKAYALKVGHHGSDTASSAPFLEKVRPAVAILSFGANNKYGHPDYYALMRLQAVNAKLYATQDGTQTLFLPAPSKTIPATQPSVQVYNPEAQQPLLFDIATTPQPVKVNIPMMTEEQKAVKNKKSGRLLKSLDNLKNTGNERAASVEQPMLF